MLKKNMEFYQIKYFWNVVRKGGLAQAGAVLHVSTSAISKGLRKLEDELECQLFDRSEKRLRLTEHGKHLLKRAEQFLLLEEQIRTELHGEGAAPELVIAGREVFLETHGIKILESFREKTRKSPADIKISSLGRFLVMSGSDALSAVEEGIAHLAITIQSPPKDWKTVVVGDVSSTVCVGFEHPILKKLGKNQTLSVEEACALDFVSPNLPLFGRSGSLYSIDGWRDDLYPRNIVLITESLSVIRQVLERGRYAAYLPKFWAATLPVFPLKITGYAFELEERIFVSAKKASDLGWLGSLVEGLKSSYRNPNDSLRSRK